MHCCVLPFRLCKNIFPPLCPMLNSRCSLTARIFSLTAQHILTFLQYIILMPRRQLCFQLYEVIKDCQALPTIEIYYSDIGCIGGEVPQGKESLRKEISEKNPSGELSQPAAPKTPGRKAKLPARCFLNLSTHFAVRVKWNPPVKIVVQSFCTFCLRHMAKGLRIGLGRRPILRTVTDI